jgi:hypothetical protein
MHRNRATVLRLQCCMDSKSVSKPEIFPHIDTPFGLLEVMQYCPLLNIHATIK